MKARPVRRSISRPVSRAVIGALSAFTPDEQKASLILDFSRNLYGVQSAEAAQ